MPFIKNKLECVATWWWKNCDDMSIRFDSKRINILSQFFNRHFWQNSRTRQTHRQTDTTWQHRPRLCIASRGKNEINKKLISTWDKRTLRDNFYYRLKHAMVVKLYHPYTQLSRNVTFPYLIGESWIFLIIAPHK